MVRRLRFIFLILLCCALLPAARNLDVYFIDVEGGQATLMVTPAGESVLVDTGWAGFNGRDADRIVAAAKKAGIKRIDYLLVTHYHLDHVGGVPQLAAKLPIRNFVDHGPTVESGERADVLFKAYTSFREKGNHIAVKPGDTVPLKGVELKVVSSGGEVIGQPMSGAGAANPYCAGFERREEDKTENARSVGTLLTYGNFRMLDLGDLTWNKEYELACPENKLGSVDVYLTTHHGMNMSGPKAIVHALNPRVAVMNNGARKGGTPEAWSVIRAAPGLEDIWQLHYAIPGGKDHNAPDAFIANTYEKCEGKWIKLSVAPDGSFTVFNTRNKYTKTYKPRS
jgi:beta-lactamase superfamily II metal-dependent hydrolase